MTSKESSQKIELVKPESNAHSTIIRTTIKKNKLKGSAKIGIIDSYLDGVIHIINIYMELAMQIISNDQTVKSNTVQDLKYFHSQSLATQAKNGKQIIL